MDNSTKQLMSALAQSGAAGVKEVFRAQLEQALNNLLKAELAVNAFTTGDGLKINLNNETKVSQLSIYMQSAVTTPT